MASDHYFLLAGRGVRQNSDSGRGASPGGLRNNAFGIMAHGTEEQKQTLLTPFLKGEVSGCNASPERTPEAIWPH